MPETDLQQDDLFKLDEVDVAVVVQALDSLFDPAELQNSPLLSSCLIWVRQQSNPGSVPTENLREVFEEVLAKVQDISKLGSEYASVLRDVYWVRERNVSTLAMDAEQDRGWSSGTFWGRLRDAKQKFTDLLLAEESACREIHLQPPSIDQSALKNASEYQQSREDTPEADFSWLHNAVHRVGQDRTLILLLAALAVVAILIGGLALWGLSNNQTTAAEQLTPLNMDADDLQLSDMQPDVSTQAITSSMPANLCGELVKSITPSEPQLLRSQGVFIYSANNMGNIIRDPYVRIVAVDESGLWFGYHAFTSNIIESLGHFDGERWLHCQNWGEAVGKNVNDILLDDDGDLWVATERAGIAGRQGDSWTLFGLDDGLPDTHIYGLAKDVDGNLWGATWHGIARFDGTAWEVLDADYTFIHHPAHDIAFVDRDIWIGHVVDGASHYDAETDAWTHFTTDNSGIGGNGVRRIAVQVVPEDADTGIWFATADGGVSVYKDGEWTVYTSRDGLPSNDVSDIAIDPYGRPWVATLDGVAYLEDSEWLPYSVISTHSIAITPDCDDCSVHMDDTIWMGTSALGLVEGRLPFYENRQAIDVIQICFRGPNTEQRICPELIEEEADANMLTAVYPEPLTPDSELRFEIAVSPRRPLEITLGDMLLSLDDTGQSLFGTWQHIEATEEVSSGEVFTFTNATSPFVMPYLGSGEATETFHSDWQVWLESRYVGPMIRLGFTVGADSDKESGGG